MSQINYPHIASMVFDTPLFATRLAVDAVKSVLIPRMQGINVVVSQTDIKSLNDQGQILAMEDDDYEQRRQQPCNGDGMYTVAKDNIAVVQVHGLLMARRGHITQACTELNSYELIRNNIQRAIDHEPVKEIVLDFSTGGGMAVGCKELADFINQVKAIKPITAIVNFAAYSAGYFLASACSKIIVSQTSGLGSIGVIIEHLEVSKYEEEVGLKFSTFYRGDHKNDCSPHEPISDQAVAAINKRLDEAYEMFVDSVALYRGLDKQAVIDTQAGLMSAQEALKLGFADELSDPMSAISNIAQPYLQAANKSRSSTGLSTRAKAMDIATQL
jgi:signal peptide peptidase SppA